MTDFSRYVAYRCRESDCRSDCINQRDSVVAQRRFCRDCFQSIAELTPVQLD